MSCKSVTIVLSFLLFLAPISAGAAYKTVTVADGGAVSGRVVFKGSPPPPVKLIITKDHEACGKGQILRKEVDVKGGALRDVVVFLEKVEQGKPFPKKAMDVIVDQRKCAYVPYIQMAAQGAKVTILNSDAAHHNIHAYELIGSARRSMWNVSQPKQRKKVNKKVRLRRGNVVRIECDVHNWMLGWMFVARNPYNAKVAEDGTFTIGGIPPGSYTLTAWHPVLGTKKEKITISANGKSTVAFTFTPK